MGLNRILNQLFMILTGFLLIACSVCDETPSPTLRYTLTVDASKGSEEAMRALTDNGSSLTASWLTTENIYVKKGDAWCDGSLRPQTNGVTAKLSGDITGQIINIDDDLTLQFPRQAIDYTGQLGTLADIAANFDYSSATAKVTSVVGNQISADAVTFVNQQAIVKFTLTYDNNPLPVTSLTISANGLKQSASVTDDITISPTSATNEIWAALSGVNGKVTLTATAEGKLYTYTTAASKTFANGKFYTVTVAMKSESEQMLSQPLTIEAIEDGTRVNFTSQSTGELEYSRDMITWTAFSVQGFSLQAGDKIYFRGNSETYYPGSTPSIISCTGPCYVYGNIMSLIDMTDFEWSKELPDNDTFRSLFENNDNIRNHPTKDLLLPATTLTQNCYSSMFKGCTGLTRAPVLPAQKLRGGCYQYMFCGCTKLAYIKCLATDIAADYCTTNWVENVNSTGTFVKAANMDDWSYGDSGIPAGWNVIEE